MRFTCCSRNRTVLIRIIIRYDGEDGTDNALSVSWLPRSLARLFMARLQRSLNHDSTI